MTFSKRRFCETLGLTGSDPRRIFRPHPETISDATGERVLGDLGADLICHAFIIDRQRRFAIRAIQPVKMMIGKTADAVSDLPITLVMNETRIRFSGFPGIFDPVEMRLVSRHCHAIAIAPFISKDLFHSSGEIVYEPETVQILPRPPKVESPK